MSFDSAVTRKAEQKWTPEKLDRQKQVEDFAMNMVGRLGTCLNVLLGSRSRHALGIVTYHRIAYHVRDLPDPLHNVRPERFREHMTGLLYRGYQIWPLNRVIDFHLRNESLPKKTVVITFDDGFESVYTQAWPVLKELNLPATIFLNTAYLGSDEPFPFDAWGVAHHHNPYVPAESYRPLTIAQCHEMQKSGLVELGAHTHTHEDFRGRPTAFQHDLEINVERLRELFGLSDVTFAFPYGSPQLGYADSVMAEAARKAGVQTGLTMEPVLVDLKTNPMTWGRFNAFPWDTSMTLAAKLAGWYSWAPKLKKRIAKLLCSSKSTKSIAAHKPVYSDQEVPT